jgi:hypothetical protein
MAKYHHDILVDPRTSCTKDEAAAILLGLRSLDPIYQNPNPQADPDEVREQFMDWLNTSIFEVLIEERDGFQSDLVDAQEENNPDEIAACKERIVHCDDTIRRAKLILCDIDHELEKGNRSTLKKDKAASEESGQVHITLTSLKAWAAGRDYLLKPLNVTQAQAVPAIPSSDESDEPLLNSEGGMNQRNAKGFLITFAVLLEQFVARTGNQFISEGGEGVNKQPLIQFLCDKSLGMDAKGHFLDGQSVASIKKRISKVIEESGKAVLQKRPKPPEQN